jgi:putative peptidoglycan lipid II flippase
MSRLSALLGTALQRGGLRRTAIAFVVIYGLARFLAFARESTVAYLFGATRDTDAYVAATTLPELAGGVLLSGVIGYTIIPDYVRRRQTGDEASAERFLQAAIWHVLVATGGLTLIAIVLAGPLTTLLAPGLEGDARADAILLLRVTSPAMVLYGVAGFAGAVLNSRHSFLAVPLSFLIGNAIGIAVLIAASPAGIIAAGLAYVGSAAVFAAAQWWPAHRVTKLALVRPVWRGAEVAAVLRAGLAAIGIVSALYLRGFVERVLASTADAGGLAALGFATRLLLVVGALLAISVGTVAFPTMAEQAVAVDRSQLVSTIRRAAAVVVGLSLPFAALFLAAPSLVVSLLFEHGEFNAGDTRVTASILQAYALGLVAICLSEILVRGLFAVGAHRRAVAAVGASLALNVGLDIWLLGTMGIAGLGVGASIALWVNAALLALVLIRAIRRPPAAAVD